MSGPLRKYRVTRGGVETVMKLSDDDAKRLGVGADAAVDGAASTIQPVQLAADSESDSGSEGDDGAAGDGGTPDGGDGAGAQPVQQAADSGGDGQTPDPQTAKEGDTPPAKKAAAKRRTTSPNKARTTSATKAADGGS